MNKEYCYILDYSDSTICKIELTEEEKELETEDLLKRHGLDIDQCAFMFSSRDLNSIIDLTY